MKDLETMTVGERYSYQSIDLELLRKCITLPEWLRENKRTRGIIDYTGYHESPAEAPPGHPNQLLLKPKTWTGGIEEIRVIPDPNNIAWSSQEYNKETKYGPKEKKFASNVYYVVTPEQRKKMWTPLPWDHIRMQAWEVGLYSWHQHMYLGHDSKTSFSLGLGYTRKVYEPKIDPHWTEEYKAQVWAEYLVAKSAEEGEKDQYDRKWGTPDRHKAVIHIRRWFKDYQPRLDLIADPKSDPAYTEYVNPGRWYYRYATKEDGENDPILAIGRKK